MEEDVFMDSSAIREFVMMRLQDVLAGTLVQDAAVIQNATMAWLAELQIYGPMKLNAYLWVIPILIVKLNMIVSLETSAGKKK